MHVSFSRCNLQKPVWIGGERPSVVANVWMRGITFYNTMTTNTDYLLVLDLLLLCVVTSFPMYPKSSLMRTNENPNPYIKV